MCSVIKRLIQMSAMRQTLALTLAFLVFFSLGGVALQSVLINELQSEIDQELTRAFASIRKETLVAGMIPQELDEQETLLAIELGHGFLRGNGALVGPFNPGIFRHRGLQTVPDHALFTGETLDQLYNAIETFEAELDSSDDLNGITVELPFDGEIDEEWRVLVGPVLDGHLVVFAPTFSSFGAFLPTVILTTMVFLAIPALAVGIYFGWRSQKRLDRIAQGYERIADGDLTVRMAPKVVRDDLDLLAFRIDGATDRLQTSLRQMSEFSANIAHDLRTPLTRLRLHLDRDVEADSDFVDSAIAQTDRIITIFDAIQRIAQLKTGERRAQFQTLDLGTVAQQAHETYSAVAEDAGRILTCELHNPAMVNGDTGLLFQLLANLIENAIRHTTPGDRIEVRVFQTEMSVCDTGPGIPPDERQKVLEPLYRLDRSRNSQGVGLGLAMVKAITDLHEAKLALSAGPEGRGLCVNIKWSDL